MPSLLLLRRGFEAHLTDIDFLYPYLDLRNQTMTGSMSRASTQFVPAQSLCLLTDRATLMACIRLLDPLLGRAGSLLSCWSMCQ